MLPRPSPDAYVTMTVLSILEAEREENREETKTGKGATYDQAKP